MILPITLTITAAATLLNLWLAVRTGQVRLAAKIDIGDGGNPRLVARMRAQANFVEYTPFFLILLGLIEFAHGSATWLWLVAIVYVVARILHAFGMDRPTPNPFRLIGIMLTFVILLGLSIYALAIPYLAPAAPVMTILG
jgi:uncharacterized membrane protein YecN with MAPEG domain